MLSISSTEVVIIVVLAIEIIVLPHLMLVKEGEIVIFLGQRV